MRSIAPRPGCRSALLLLAALALVLSPTSAAQPASPPREQTEVRALWVLRTSLTTPASIAQLVRTASEHGFNTLLVQVRGRGDAYYAGRLEPRAPDLQRQPASFDPLATLLEASRAAGLAVHAWINVNLVSSAVDLPIARTHIIHRHPEWLMVPRDIAQELARVPARSPAYVGRLARWTRTQENVEGLYASPLVPASADHVEAVVADIAKRYALDGIHLDYARFPSPRYDYSRAALAAFRQAVRPALDPAVRADLDRREAIDLFAYPDALPERWHDFRVERMTALMRRLHDAVKSVRPRALVTVAAVPDIHEALETRLQDWRGWLHAGIVDSVALMAYTQEAERFADQIAAARDAAGDRDIWAGIGAWRLPAAQTIANIRTARRLGADGVVLFSYDSLVDPRQAPADYLAVVARTAFATASDAGTR